MSFGIVNGIVRDLYFAGLLGLLTASASCQQRFVIEDLSETTFAQVRAQRETHKTAWQASTTRASAMVAQELPKQTPPTKVEPDDPATQRKKRQTPPHESIRLVMLSRDNWTPINKTQKFGLFWQDLISPGTHLSIAGAAWLSWATNDQSYMGPNFKGWAKRYGYGVADEANGQFFSAFLLPVIFKQDPRYLPMDHGRKRDRIAYAMSRVVITRSDSGREVFNVSHVGGAIIASNLSNLYYPDGRDNSTRAAFERVGFGLATDSAYNIFIEFWPDFARKLHLGKFFQQLVRRTIRIPSSTY